MKKNENGFGAVGALLVLAVVGIIGGAGWYVWQSRQSKSQSIATNQENSQTQQQTEQKPADNCEASFKSMSNEKIGIAFCYPDGWATEVTDKPINHIVGSITLTSPDYKLEESGFGGSKNGSKVYVSVHKIDQLGATYTSVKSILDGTEQGKMAYSDVKAAKIAGRDGASFVSAYEGPRFRSNQFEHNGNEYSIVLEEDLDGPKFNDNQDAYQKIVNSFKLLSE